jgi:hypothetical protein
MRDAEMAAAPGELSTLLVRLRASADRIAALDEEREAERLRRDSMVIEARDLMAPWKQIARAARRSAARCVAIVGGT